MTISSTSGELAGVDVSADNRLDWEPPIVLRLDAMDAGAGKGTIVDSQGGLGNNHSS